MATYRYTNNGPKSLKLTDRPIYGSKRIGSYTRTAQLAGVLIPTTYVNYVEPMQSALMRYELNDHLGNVTSVITGRLLPGNNAGSPHQAELISAQGYEPFGSLLPGRNYSSSSYAFGFQGQEKDDEVYGATGTSYAFEYRMHDARVGRFMSVDPLAFKYPFYSPYAFSGNRVIDMVELEGLEPEITSDKLKAQGDQNSAWGFGARGSEGSNWQQNINGQDYQTYQCADCFGNNDRGDRQGLENPLMWGKVPALATIPDNTNGGAVGGDVPPPPPNQTTLQVPNATNTAPPPLNTPVNFAGRFQGNDNQLTGATADAANAQLGQIGAFLAANPNARVNVTINTTLPSGTPVFSRDANNPFAGTAVDKRGAGAPGLLQGRSQTIQQGLNSGFGGAVPNGQVNFMWQTGQPNTNTSVTVRP